MRTWVLRDMAGGVILLREWVEVDWGKRLSRCVRRDTVTVGDPDRTCLLVRERVAAASGAGGQAERCATATACAGRGRVWAAPRGRSRFRHACRGCRFAFPTTTTSSPSATRRGRSRYFCWLISCHLVDDSLCLVRLPEILLGFIWMLFLMPASGEASLRTLLQQLKN